MKNTMMDNLSDIMKDAMMGANETILESMQKHPVYADSRSVLMKTKIMRNFFEREREREDYYYMNFVDRYDPEFLEEKIVKLHLCHLLDIDSIEKIEGSYEELLNMLYNEKKEIKFLDRWSMSLLDPNHYLDRDRLYYNFSFKEMQKKFYSAVNIYRNMRDRSMPHRLIPVSKKDIRFFRASWREENFRKPIPILKNAIRFYFALIKYYNYNPILRIFKTTEEGEK